MLRILGIAFFVLATLALAYGAWVYPRAALSPSGDLRLLHRPDGARIALYTSGDGPRIVLLASLGRSVSDFNDLVPVLNDAGYRTLAVESRGIEESTMGPAGQESLYTLANDIEAALSADGASSGEQVFLMGHAFGNRVARAYAHLYPERGKGVGLIASGGAQKLTDMPDVLSALQGSFKWWNLPPLRRADIRYAFFADSQPIPDSWLRGWYVSASKWQARAVANTPEQEWREAGGRAPILVLQGMEDRIAPASLTSAKLKAAYPDRVLVCPIKQAGHALLPEAPDLIARHVVAFLNAQVEDTGKTADSRKDSPACD